jgi:hypothetical protein
LPKPVSMPDQILIHPGKSSLNIFIQDIRE